MGPPFDHSGAGWTVPDIALSAPVDAMPSLLDLLSSFAIARDGLFFRAVQISPATRRHLLGLPGEAKRPELVSIDISTEHQSGSGPTVARLRRGDGDPSRSRGFQVAFLGPDGVGKSTVVDRVAALLRPAFAVSEVVYMRPGLLPGRSVPGGPDGSTGPHDIPVYAPLPSILKLAFLLTDYIAGYWLTLRPKLARSSLIVCDRYYLDVVADPARYRYGGPAALVDLAARFVPGPDVYVVLTAPVEVIQSRRAEMTPDETAAQLAGYETVAAQHPRILVVDASGTPDEVVATAAWATLSAIAERHGLSAGPARS